MADSNKIGNNIKNLRKSFGETQLELALAIGVDSPNTIGNYEKGIRSPQSDIRKKIAAHYRITEDELVNSSFNGKRIKNAAFDDPKKLSEMTLVMLPIVESETALANEKFKAGYKAHLRAYDAMRNNNIFSDKDFELCIDYYDDAYEKDGVPEAAVNALWWLMVLEISVKNQWMVRGAEALFDNRVKGKDFMKKFFLRDMSEEDAVLDDSGFTEKEAAEIDESIIEVLKELKCFPEWRDIVDYYIAIRYASGCIINDLSPDMNRTIGYEMLSTLMEFDNKYAKNFILYSIKNI